MPLEPGRLRHKVVIRAPTRTSDSKGGYVTTYPTATETVWASLQPLGSRDRMQAAQIAEESTHTMTVRYTSNLTRDARIYFGSQVFSVISIRNPEERDEMQVAMLKEETT